MNKNSSTYCILSHTGMALQNYADFCPCNQNKMSWKNNRHEILNVYDHPVCDSFQSYTRKMLAAALDNNQRHPSCQSCWHKEDVGIQSLRQQYNTELKNIIPDKDQPKVLTIKPGNTCNMACRMCNAETSSSWYADSYKLLNPEVSFREYTKEFEIIRNSYEPSNTKLWNDLKSWMSKMEVISIYGGEPFLSPAMFDLLEHGVNIGAANKISIKINTNASIWNQRYLDILKHYGSVDFKVSADSHVPAQFEYIRHKSDFKNVITNIIRFRNELQNLQNFNTSCIMTVTPLNVFYVDDIEQNLSQQLGMPISTNIVHSSEYDIRHLPVSIKTWLIDNIKNHQVKSFLQQTIPGCDIEWPKFCRVTDQLDQIRGQSFQTAFPEWWNMLKPYWVGNND